MKLLGQHYKLTRIVKVKVFKDLAPREVSAFLSPGLLHPALSFTFSTKKSSHIQGVTRKRVVIVILKNIQTHITNSDLLL